MPSDQSAAPSAGSAPDPRRWRALGVLALAVSLIVIDGTVVNVALPTMIAAVPLSFSEAQWVTTLYSLVFAALLITTGRLGDAWGRRTTLYLGLAAFAAGSLLAGAAAGAGALLLARGLQGIGGAFVLPSTLSTVNATFQDRERSIAFGIWGATISGAAAIGPLLGGWLTSDFGWRWIFGINLPLTALIAVGAALWVPQTRGSDDGSAARTARTAGAGGTARGFDAGGLVLSALGMGGIVFGLIEGRSLGWWSPLASGWARAWPLSPAPLAIAVGSVCLAGFVGLEVRRRSAGRDVLLDMSLFRLPSFAWGNLAAGVVAMGEFGLLFVLPLFLQNVRGLSAIGAGWVLAAMAAAAFLSGGAAGPFARATAPATVATTGLVLEAAGVAALAALMGADGGLWRVIAPLAVYGAGLGMASAQLTGTILVDVPPAQSGQGSATQSTVRQLGSALGTAVIATLLASAVASAASGTLAEADAGTTGSASGLPAAVAAQLEGALAPSAGGVIGAVRAGQDGASALPAAQREAVAEVLARDFTSGARVPLWAGAAFLAIGAAATTRLPRRRD